MDEEPVIRPAWLVLGVVAALLVGLTIGWFAHRQPTAAPPPSSVGHPLQCQPDPAAAIEALPAGGTWKGAGCYTTMGIEITKNDVTIDGGTFEDPVVIGSPKPIKPIIRVQGSSGDTIENVSLIGTNTVGGYHGALVGEAGIDVRYASDLTVYDVNTVNTFGDGITFGFEPREPESTGAKVTGLTITNAGRQGVTVAYLADSTFTNVTMNSSADTGVDFESDEPGIGSSNVTFTGYTGAKGFTFVEALQGPCAVNASTFSGDIGDTGDAATSGKPITFTGDTVAQRRFYNGLPPGGIFVNGPGNLTISGSTFTRNPGTQAPTGPAWVVENGGQLVLTGDTFVPPLGTHDATSTVTVTP